MSKISKCVKRFENVRVGSDIRKKDKDKKRIGKDERPLVRVTGITGKKATVLMEMSDNKEVKEMLKFLVLDALQVDDPTTTEEDYNEMDMADLLNIANARTRLSGMGELFDFNKKKEGKTQGQSNSSNIDSFHKEFREKVKDGII